MLTFATCVRGTVVHVETRCMPVRPSRKAKWIATLWFRKLAAGAIGTLVYPTWTRAGRSRRPRRCQPQAAVERRAARTAVHVYLRTMAQG